MEFYSITFKKKIKIPEEEIRYEERNGRRFAVGKYFVGKKEYNAWKIIGGCDKTKKKKGKKK